MIEKNHLLMNRLSNMQLKPTSRNDLGDAVYHPEGDCIQDI